MSDNAPLVREWLFYISDMIDFTEKVRRVAADNISGQGLLTRLSVSPPPETMAAHHV